MQKRLRWKLKTLPIANASRKWLRLIITIAYRAFRGSASVPAILHIVFVLLAASVYVSAQGDFESLATTCAYKKAYAVIVKLLAVYASHVVTIRVEPGLALWATTISYLTAALLPSSSALISCRDLFYRYRSFKTLPDGENKEITGYYRNMQKAINAGSVCIRAKRNLVKSGWKVEKSRTVRGRPLGQDEVFLMVPRGTSASLFEPTMIEGSSQFLQVFVGAVQLGLATLQLYSASSARVKAYGYGAFIYTIIPYAFGSAINVICGIFVNGYPDLAEMELKYTELARTSSSPSNQGFCLLIDR
jgi:hypothetical protein